MRVDLLVKAMGALRRGRLGDAAVYKSLALAVMAHPEVERRLAALDDPLPDIDLARLRTLPTGSFGRVYAEHMDRCGLTPLRISPECRRDLPGQPLLGPRYALFHDVFHVLLACDTSLAGECEVWSFVSGQGYGPRFDTAGRTSLISYGLVRPWRLGALREAHARGLARGRAAACLLTLPLERYWETPLDALRVTLGVTPAEERFGLKA